MFGITFLLVAGYDSMTKSRSRFCSKKKCLLKGCTQQSEGSLCYTAAFLHSFGVF